MSFGCSLCLGAGIVLMREGRACQAIAPVHVARDDASQIASALLTSAEMHHFNFELQRKTQAPGLTSRKNSFPTWYLKSSSSDAGPFPGRAIENPGKVAALARREESSVPRNCLPAALVVAWVLTVDMYCLPHRRFHRPRRP